MDHKSSIRERVFAELRKVAFPDSRFHYNFAEFITDFHDSDRAIDRLMSHRFYRDAGLVFITPDNCLEQLRYRTLLEGKRILMTTYAITRGFWLLDPTSFPPGKYLYAATLDGMERFGTPVTLEQIKRDLPVVDYMITGTGAVNEEGIRFGKGHGFFDAEWGMLHRIGVICSATPSAVVVHDCQVLRETLYPEVFDTVADVIFTPTRTIEVRNPHKPTCGIVWDLLDPRMFESIPPLQELKAMELSNSSTSVPSPCRRNCCLNEDLTCLGCFRSLDEIKEWTVVDMRRRRIILQNAQQRRAEYQALRGTGGTIDE